jgi:hypothetical protein
MEPTSGAQILSNALPLAKHAYAKGDWWHRRNDRASLVDGLVKLAEQMKPADAAQVLSQASARETDADACAILAATAARMEPSNATRVAQTQFEVLTRDTILPETRQPLLQNLASATNQLEPTQTERIYAELSQRFAVAIERETKPEQRANLASLLASIAQRPRPGRSRKVWEAAVQTLAASFEKEKDARAQGDLVWGLAPLAERLGADEAARVCRPRADSLSTALKKDTRNLDKRGFSLVRGLGAMMLRLPQDQAVQIIRLLASVAEETRGGTDSRTVDFYYLMRKLDQVDATRVARLLASALEKEKDKNIRWWLAAGLCLAAEKMDPGEVAQVCGPVAKDMADSVATRKASGDLECNGYLFSGFGVVATQLDRARASQASKVLSKALERETDSYTLIRLAKALASTAGRIDPTQAAQVCGQAARLLAAKFEQETYANQRESLAQALSSLAARMEPARAAQICEQAVRTLAKALENEENPSPARLIGCMVYNNNSPSERPERALAILWLAGYLESTEADQLCGEVIRTLLTRLKAPDDSMVLLLSQLDPATAGALAREFALQVCSKNDIAPDGLGVILNDYGRTPPDPHFIGTRSVSGESLPCRLPTQDLVELLKMPTCFGRARRVVLDHLGNRYGRRFMNHWEFVRYAREQGLELDFTTPPRRPNPEESLKRMLQILDGSPAPAEAPRRVNSNAKAISGAATP